MAPEVKGELGGEQAPPSARGPRPAPTPRPAVRALGLPPGSCGRGAGSGSPAICAAGRRACFLLSGWWLRGLRRLPLASEALPSGGLALPPVRAAGMHSDAASQRLGRISQPRSGAQRRERRGAGESSRAPGCGGRGGEETPVPGRAPPTPAPGELADPWAECAARGGAFRPLGKILSGPAGSGRENSL